MVVQSLLDNKSEWTIWSDSKKLSLWTKSCLHPWIQLLLGIFRKQLAKSEISYYFRNEVEKTCTALRARIGYFIFNANHRCNRLCALNVPPPPLTLTETTASACLPLPPPFAVGPDKHWIKRAFAQRKRFRHIMTIFLTFSNSCVHFLRFFKLVFEFHTKSRYEKWYGRYNFSLIQWKLNVLQRLKHK